MQQPGTSKEGTSPAVPASAPAAAATELVTRPEPGLARGKWEAPVWVFWVMLAVVILGAAAYLLRRLGILRIDLGQKLAKDQPSPPSSRARRP
jgi:hypothetical protein